ncbi:MAG: type II toxin-antitoxin system RelE/ParE family toxin [Gammaproteobacteria bacterium]|nr:MAG: type II toxin-antitoxin system RelE/ParE family toxin [Gammaproteobacteria bacterium]
MRIRFLTPARRDLEDAVLYYGAQRSKLGGDFVREVRSTIKRIAEFPEAWHSLSGSIRRCQMNRFPYGIIYTATGNNILIIAVAHLHREPDHWRLRFDES